PAWPQTRRQRWLRAGPSHRRAAARLAGLPTRPGASGALRAESDLRHAARVVLRRRRADAMVGRADDARRGRPGTLLHGRARVPLDVAGLLWVTLASRRR